VDSIGTALQHLDLEGRRVGVLLPNTPPFRRCSTASLRAGAPPCMMNPQYSPREARR
jgi:acyl-CoA synthetase (AMP-forming)/AMP-acid ligase II